MKFSIHSLLILFLGVTGAFAQSDWKRAAAQDGITVYTKNVADSKIKAMKANCQLHASITEIVALLMDVNAAEKWVCHTRSCTLVRRISDQELLYHTEVSLPWPLDNRDFVTHLKVTRDPHADVVTVDAPAVPGILPIRKGVVRVTQSVNRWTLRAMPNGHTWVEYTLQVDPGGHIPAHVVNMFACRAPIDTFRNMRKILEERRRQRTDTLK